MDPPTPAGAAPSRRQAAKTARATFAAQLSDSEPDAKNAESDGAAGGSKRRGRAQGAQTIKGRRRAATVVGAPSRAPALAAAGAAASTDAVIAPQPRPRPRPRPIVRKPTPPPLPPLVVPASSILDPGEMSDLTPLTLSPEGLSALSQPASGARSALPSPVRPKRSEAPPPPRSPVKKIAPWKAAALGSYVWVLVEPTTWCVYDEEAEEAEREALWWPAQIASALNTDVPLKVKLFGLADTAVSIATPSAANVLPRDLDYVQRFLVPTFVPPAPFAATTSKNKKKQAARDALTDKWDAAVRAMRNHDAAAHSTADIDSDESDYPGPTANLFDFLTAPPASSQSISAPVKSHASNGNGKGKTSVTGKGKRKRASASDGSADEEVVYVSKKKEKKGDEWWDEVDEDVNLPGELVLGRTAQAVDVDHWPGKLLAYIPPTKPRTVGKYSVLWLDGTQGLIPRLWFYSTDQDEFATCKLGEFDSAVVEVQNDLDADEATPTHELARRQPSPVPRAPPPSGEHFASLPIREQFVYTKGVLTAILNDEYAPVREKQARFMRGGKHRQSLVDDASLRGKMDPRDVSDLLAYVREWCLRDGGRRAGAPRGEDDRAPGGKDASANGDGGDGGGGGSTKHAERALAVQRPSFEEMNASGAMRASSPCLTAGFPSSPQMPPSSYPATLERETSIASIASDVGGEVERIDIPSSPPAMSIVTEAGTLAVANGAIDEDILDLTVGGKDSGPLQPSMRPKQRGSNEFESLIDLDKVDYCTNILLPEAVRQVLLWRNGSRTSAALLPPAEEEDLYEEGARLLAETDWVNDVVRYRKMMQAVLPKAKQSQTVGRRETVGRTGRLRRNIVIPNYQE